MNQYNTKSNDGQYNIKSNDGQYNTSINGQYITNPANRKADLASNEINNSSNIDIPQRNLDHTPFASSSTGFEHKNNDTNLMVGISKSKFEEARSSANSILSNSLSLLALVLF